MSLETRIEELTRAVMVLTAKLEGSSVEAPPAPAPAAPPPPPPPTTPPVTAPAPESSGAPFVDAKGLIEYVMLTYKNLGPQKGAQIQSVLSGLGYQNINDVKAEHYGKIFAGIEALK
jgi:hypothetical protein